LLLLYNYVALLMVNFPEILPSKFLTIPPLLNNN
jgi:hypothetical protein